MSFTFCEKSSSSVAEGCGGGGGAALTVTRAVACCVRPGPFAVSAYVVESAGVTDCEPLGCTAPTPSMLTSVAFEVSHLQVADWPLSIVLGFAVSDAVGAVGGGGGGGGGGATFFLQPPSNITVLNANTSATHFMLFVYGFTLLLPAESRVIIPS